MQELLDFFATLGETIVFLIDYVIGLIGDLVELLFLLVTTSVQLPLLLSFLPSSIVTILLIFLAAAILFKVLGREG